MKKYTWDQLSEMPDVIIPTESLEGRLRRPDVCKLEENGFRYFLIKNDNHPNKDRRLVFVEKMTGGSYKNYATYDGDNPTLFSRITKAISNLHEL